MLNIFGSMTDISFFGWGNSELDEYAQKAADQEHKTISPDPVPAAGLFYRSDHFPFYKKGVAGVFLAVGTQSVKHESAWAGLANHFPNATHFVSVQQAKKWTMECYHKPGLETPSILCLQS